jgi:hypothetical protein
MNTKKELIGMMIASAAVLFFVQSCSKEEAGSISQADVALAQDDTYAEALYEEVDNMVIDEVVSLDANAYDVSGLKSTGDEDPCFTVNIDFPDSTRFPKVITLDYGEGCTVVLRDDTITRKGQIIITLTDRWFVPGARHIVTFNNFSINDVAIQGTRTMTNEGLNDEGHLLISIKLEGGLIAFSSTEILTLEAEYQREWIRNRTPQLDTLIITGSANGVNVQGENFSRVITDPLVLVHCSEYRWRWVIVDGTVELTNSTTGVTIVEYSAEGCDGTVMINRNGYRHNYAFKYNNRHRNGR